MINIPKKYEINKKIPIKDFIPLTLKADVRKKIKELVIKVILTFQINDEEIPSLKNETYDCRIIQFFDFELKDIKKAKYISDIYQELIKAPCIIRMYDSTNEVFSFGLKRLNQNDKNEVVLIDSFLSNMYNKILPSSEKKEFYNILSFENIINRNNKFNFYFEMFVKSFIIKHQKLYVDYKELLQKPIWYDENNIKETYELFKNMVDIREKIEKSHSNSEKVKYNQELKEILEKLEKI